jgi:hypothetical protein
MQDQLAQSETETGLALVALYKALVVVGKMLPSINSPPS